jgi:light-regulated signal transduction histidine kinase (bacteriophytochrome)
VRKDGSKKPSKPIYAGADEEDFGLTAISANVQEFIGQEKWQGNGKQGKESAARAKVAAQQSATPRGKGGKGNGGGGGGWKARSGGAAAVESDEMTIEELKSQLMEQKAAATEARLKLLESQVESQAAARSQGLGP